MAQRGRIPKLEGFWFSLVWNTQLGWAKLYHPMALRYRSFSSRVSWPDLRQQVKKKVVFFFFDSQAWAIIYTGGERIYRDPPTVSVCSELLSTELYLRPPERSAHGVDDELWGGGGGNLGPSWGSSEKSIHTWAGSLCVCVLGGNLHDLQDPSHF